MNATFQIDERVVELVAALNELPGVLSFSSCGGHSDPEDSQVGEGEFYVNFTVDRNKGGWRSLDLITWAAWPAWVTAWFNGAEFFEGGLCFELHGDGEADPDAIAELLRT